MAVPVAFEHGAGLRRVRDQRRRRDVVDRLIEAALCARRHCQAPGIPVEKVHANWIPGPGAYGRNDGGDAALDAAAVAQAVGRPVRVQYMRYEGHGWDPKGPASIHRARAGLDAQGNVIAYRYESKASRASTSTPTKATRATASPGSSWGSSSPARRVFGVPGESYGFPASFWRGKRSRRSSTAPRRCARRICAIPSGRRSISPANPSSTRSPTPPARTPSPSASIPQGAARHCRGEGGGRESRLAGRVSGSRGQVSDGVAAGRGFAYCQRGRTVIAVVADVEVDLKSGAVEPQAFRRRA